MQHEKCARNMELRQLFMVLSFRYCLKLNIIRKKKKITGMWLLANNHGEACKSPYEVLVVNLSLIYHCVLMKNGDVDSKNTLRGIIRAPLEV